MDDQETSARHLPLRPATATLVYGLGTLVTACMAAWFVHYLFNALSGELTLTDRPRGPAAADVPWKPEPGSFWLFVAVWLAAAFTSARAALDCARHALHSYRQSR